MACAIQDPISDGPRVSLLQPKTPNSPTKPDQPDRPEQPVESRAIDGGSVEERSYPAAVGWEGGGTDRGVLGAGAE
jgi:hypothetical protein